MGFTITADVTSLPDDERRHVEALLRYHLTVLAAMPKEQRFAEYARAQTILLHYSRVTDGEFSVGETPQTVIPPWLP